MQTKLAMLAAVQEVRAPLGAVAKVNKPLRTGRKRPVLAALLATSFYLSMPVLGGGLNLGGISALAETNESAAKTSAVSGKLNLDSSAKSIGVDVKMLVLMNKGAWTQAITRLAMLTGKETAPSRQDGWLAFGYMFEGQCQELKTLADKVAGFKTGGDQVCAQIAQAFNLICDGKSDLAEPLLQKLVTANDNDVLAHFALAAAAGKLGKADLAIQHCQKTIDLAPDFAWAYRTLGFIEDRWLKNPNRAEFQYKKALAIEPDFQEARDLLVDVLLVKNNFDDACDFALAGIKHDHASPKGYYRLAQIYMEQWRLKEALPLLNKAIMLNPKEAKYHRTKSLVLRYQGSLDQALVEQQAAVDLSHNKAFDLVELALLNVMADNTNRAADNLLDALKLDPDNQVAHEKLVMLLTKEKRLDALAAEYKRVIERKPKIAELHLSLARILKDQGKIELAAAEFKQAANLDQKDPTAHREMGAILLASKDYDGAAREFTRALNINPSSVEDLESLGNCYALNQDYLQAEAAMVTGIALQQLSGPQVSPTFHHLDLMRALAALLLKEGRYVDAASQLEAVSAYSKTAQTNPYDQFLLAEAKALRDRSNLTAKDFLKAYENLPEEEKESQRFILVDSLIKANQADMAIEILAKLEPKSGEPGIDWLIYSSQCWQLKGDLAKSNQLAKQAVATKVDSPIKLADAQLQLSRVLLAQGDWEGAQAANRKAIGLNSKSYAAQEFEGRIALTRNDREKAILFAKRALEMNPYYVSAYLLQGDANAQLGKWQEALDNYKKAVELHPGLLEAHKSVLNACYKLSLKDDAEKEKAQITEIEKHN